MSEWSRRDVIKSALAASAGGFAVTPEVRRAMRAGSDGRVANDLAGLLQDAGGRERLLLDAGWRFHLGHADDPAQDFGYGTIEAFAKTGEFFAPGRADFDASAWRGVTLPHDWAVELPFESAADLVDQGFKPLGRAHPATSIGWYRRVFDLPATDHGRRLALEFDGVFRDCLVVLNGVFLGRNLSGYAPFRFDITDMVNYGGPNVLVVRVDATEHEGWFYEGAGIYRHVWLVKTAPVHVAPWGTFVRTDVRRGAATVTVQTEVANDGEGAAPCRVRVSVTDQAGRVVGSATSAAVRPEPRSSRTLTQHIVVNAPKLWSLESPNLYRLTTSVESGGRTVDRTDTPFGIRTMRFDPDRGFFLNGERVELKGTCNHQDHAGVGSAVPDRLQYYRIERLRAMGSNAYRTSHNPPTRELLDACDRLGMLVLDETRMMSSSEEGLSQLERMIRRDRNHPCVFAWSIGNEEWLIHGSERGALIAAGMKRLVRRLDPSRPITAAMNGAWGRGVSPVLDVMGCNYYQGDFDDYHRQHPLQPMMATEIASTVSTRGVYANDETRGYVSAYDVNKPRWGSTAQTWWTDFDARPFLAGGFVWTGFDYRGEPTPYRWPCINSHFGIMDTCGFPKDNFFYYQAWWSSESVLHLFPHWNWPGREGQEIEVWCHSNLERVELLLNGRSLGAQDVRRDTHLMWRVPYEPGRLEARGFKGGAVVLTEVRETTGAPARVVLRPDRPRISGDGEDLVVVTVEIDDAAGRLVPVAGDLVTFQVSGPGRLVGVGNGDPSSHEDDQGDSRRAFNGLCQAIVRSTGETGDIRLVASAPALEPATLVIACDPASPRPAVP